MPDRRSQRRQEGAELLALIRYGDSRARSVNIWLHAATVSAVVFVHLLLGEPQITLLFGGLLCFPVYLYIGISEARHSTLRIGPLSYYFVWYSVGLGLSPLYIRTILQRDGAIPFSVVNLPGEPIATGYVIFLLGSLALHCGIQRRRPRRAAMTNLAARKGSALPGLAILYLGGLLSLWHVDWLAFLGAPGRILQWGAIAAVSAVALTAPSRLHINARSHAIIIGLGTLGLFVVNMMSYSKAYIMFSFLPVVWMFYLRHDLRRWLPGLIILLASVYLLLVAPAIAKARFTQLQPGETAFDRVSASFVDRLRGGEEPVGIGGKEGQGEQFLSRQYDAVVTGYFVTEVERSGLQMGNTMTYLAYAFVPRVLWPGKPAVTRGAWFAYYIGFAESEAKSTTSLGLTATGELYWNFGVIGVVLGMYFLGALYGTLWRLAGDDPRGVPLHMLLYTMIVLSLPNMSEAVSVLTSIVAAYLIVRFGQAITNALSFESAHVTEQRIAAR